MSDYFFEKRTKAITETNVRNIITKAGFDANAFTYQPMMSADQGYIASGAIQMAEATLVNAAKKLDISVTIRAGALLGAQVPGAARDAGDGSPYSFDFAMSAATVDALKGYSLVVFKGVKTATSSNGAVPLAWFVSKTFGTDTNVSWTENYSAYTSNSEVIPGGVIRANSPVPIAIGQTLNVDGQGIGTPVTGGQDNAISILNQSAKPFLCGVAQTPPGATEALPMCAFPLHGNGLDVIIPQEHIFLMFATGTVDTGTVYEKSYGQGLMVDLTGIGTLGGVSYDIDAGWDTGGSVHATVHEASSNLLPLLITSDSSHQQARAA